MLHVTCFYIWYIFHSLPFNIIRNKLSHRRHRGVSMEYGPRRSRRQFSNGRRIARILPKAWKIEKNYAHAKAMGVYSVHELEIS